VAHGERAGSHKRIEVEPEKVPFHDLSTQGVGPIQDDHFLSGAGRGPEASEHGGGKGVNPGSHILQINYQNVDEIQHVWQGLPDPGVEAENRHLAAGIKGVFCLDHVVLVLAAIPMLRPEERFQLPWIKFRQDRACGAETKVQGGLIGEKAQSTALETLWGVILEHIKTGAHDGHETFLRKWRTEVPE
jgi:hypothetical protein